MSQNSHLALLWLIDCTVTVVDSRCGRVLQTLVILPWVAANGMEQQLVENVFQSKVQVVHSWVLLGTSVQVLVKPGFVLDWWKSSLTYEWTLVCEKCIFVWLNIQCVKDGLDLDDSLWKQASGGQQPGIIDISWSVESSINSQIWVWRWVIKLLVVYV